MLLFSGCASWRTNAGVHNTWRAPETPVWEVGVTTANDVTSALGPPSQLIALHDETVYYYMREGASGNALLLLVFNTGSQTTTYDRAMFFFDKKGVLTDYSYSKETLKYANDN
ncbi:hypothetical protein [Coraliomargarita akajimensis]|nr:hypothetical protein [Coraliomargarita akajimensis]